MRIVVTGDQGLVGRVVAAHLRDQGHDVVGYDRAAGHDILDRVSLRRALEGCQAVVHLAAVDLAPEGVFAPLQSPSVGSHEDVMLVNALGTQFVLAAAAHCGVRRVVFMSSVDVLGIFMGERAPDYLPIDDEHPTYPRSPYALAKRLAEELCRAFTEDTGVPTICLRPPGVCTAETYAWIREARAATPEIEWTPFWEYGAFIDVRDVATAVACALHCPIRGHTTALLCAEDISSAELSSRALVHRLLPAVPWRGGPEYERDPYRALLRCDRARSVLNWRPRYRWRAAPDAGSSRH